MRKDVAFACNECEKINVFPVEHQEEAVCMECGRTVRQIGDIMVYEQKEEIENTTSSVTLCGKEINKYVIGRMLFDALRWSNEEINSRKIIYSEKDSKDIVIKESDLMKLIQLVNTGQKERKVILVSDNTFNEMNIRRW